MWSDRVFSRRIIALRLGFECVAWLQHLAVDSFANNTLRGKQKRGDNEVMAEEKWGAVTFKVFGLILNLVITNSCIGSLL